MTTMLNFYSHPLQDLNCQCTNHVGSLLLWRPLYNQVTSDRSDRSDRTMFPNMGFIIRLLLLWMLIVCSRAEGEAVLGYLHTSYTYEESPRGAADLWPLKYHKWPKAVYSPKLWHQHIKISAQLLVIEAQKRCRKSQKKWESDKSCS